MIRNVLEYLEATAERLPEKTAFANDSFELSFSQLIRASKGIGTSLGKSGYTREPVVIYMKKHPNMIAAFWGAVYSGCFYVPIDEEMPEFRIKLIFESLKPRAVICDESTVEKTRALESFDGEIFLFDEAAKTEPDSELLASVRRSSIDTDPIYIVFTSGSTGIPKGVVACHRSVIDYVENLTEVLGVTENSVFANQTPLYFDACLKEMFSTLMYGATTYLVPKELFMFPIKLVEFLNEHKINTVCWVVSALTMISSMKTFDTVKPLYLHTVAFGSEVFPLKQFRLWRSTLPEARFINLYGPTEATGMSCYYEVNRDFEDGEAIPIGRPFKNTEILLLDENNRLAKQGEAGEICIRGTAVTLGYYNNLEKTDEAFVQNPLNNAYHELIYRTGDIGKLNDEGELVFISRKDYQIKHMGHRIELGEIDTHVNMIEGVRTACSVYDKEKGKIMLFYVGDIDKKELIAKLKETLPRYMIPNKVLQIERMPLTENGKINRKELMSL